MKNIKIAVLGVNSRGRLALLAHRPEQGIHVVMACAIHPDGLEIFREACGPDLAFETDYRKVIADKTIDAIFICTPDHFHEEHAVAALDAGKYVYLEKPMATSIEGCDRILAASDRNPGQLYVGHNMRFFPVMQKMRSLIDEGRIGRVEAVWCRHFISYGGDAYFKDWHSDRKNVTSLLLQKGSHDIDIIHYLAGSYTRRVVGMGKLSVYNEVEDRRAQDEIVPVSFNRENWPPLSQKGLSPTIDVEDHSMLLMSLANGVQASYLQCHYTPDDCRNYTVIGTEGRIENYGDHSSDEQWASVYLWNRRMGYNGQGNEIFRVPNRKGDHGGADPEVVQDFLNFVAGQPFIGATPQDARMSVAVGALGTKSLREGSLPQDIP